ncbi:MAG TPA: hypothetical protein DCQ06_02135, partial [Myxococcales bacterium]|nr:hypothetical protein [Myxococcales bacterium]
MYRPTPSNRSLHLFAGVFALWLSGCQLGTAGDSGELRFRDLTRYRSQQLFTDAKLDRPLALGAKMTIEVSAAFGAPVSIKQLTVKPQGLLSVSVTNSRVEIKAQALGTANLKLVTSDGTEDSVSLEVVKPTSWSLIPSPWIALMPLPAEMWKQGLKLMMKSRMTVYGEALGNTGQRLMGHGASQFELPAGAASSLSVKP